jgi:hypothetical protein
MGNEEGWLARRLDGGVHEALSLRSFHSMSRWRGRCKHLASGFEILDPEVPKSQSRDDRGWLKPGK